MVTTIVFTVVSVHVELRTEKKYNKMYWKTTEEKFYCAGLLINLQN